MRLCRLRPGPQRIIVLRTPRQRHQEQRDRALDKPKKSVRRRTAGVTIDEVAALAGVSPMTVSRVINQGKVRDVTRERVLRAVRELGYTPNLAASSLAAAQHTRIALIYTNPSGAYLRELLVGLLRVASSSAIQLVIDYWDNRMPNPNAGRRARSPDASTG